MIRDVESKKKKRKPARNFTLVELLSVMVIMAIIMGIGVAAFQNLSTGSGVDGACRMVNAQLRLARQYAISNRQKVALIMPANQSGLPEEYKYASFRAAVVTSSGSNTYTWENWIPNTKWEFVPVGACIMEVDDDCGIHDGSNYVLEPDINSSPVNYAQVNDVDMSSIDASLSAVDGVRAVVFAANGRRSGDSEHVTIAQATFQAPSTWIIRNVDNISTNKSAANQFNISINSFTGRTEIKTPDEY